MEVTKHHLSLPAQSWNLEELRAFCKRSLAKKNVSRQLFRQIVLAIDEAAANIIDHAYPEGTAKQDLHLDIEVLEDRVVIEIRDNGIPFNLLNAIPCDPQKSVRSGQRRGYGIALIKRIIEDLRYERSPEGENKLTMTKLIEDE